jgi:hypothetical protein
MRSRDISAYPFNVLVNPLIEIIEREYMQKGRYKDFKEFFSVLLHEIAKHYPK